MKTINANSEKRNYHSPMLDVIIFDSVINLQMESHETGLPPTEPGWETQFSEPTVFPAPVLDGSTGFEHLKLE